MTRYPSAEWLGNGQSGGSYTGGPRRVVLHTTETRTLPGYQDGATAPHLTYAPASRKWWQHTDLDTAARALRNETGGIQTNRDSAWQVEVICYSDRNVADRVGGLWVGDLLTHAYDDLRAFCEWAGVPLTWPGRAATSYSQANATGFRLSPAEWDSFHGVCGHQHVPENTHWDPGAFDWTQLLQLDLQEDDMAIPAAELDPAEVNTLKYLHKAFDSATGATRLDQLDRLIEDVRSDIITRSELVAALKDLPSSGLTIEQVVTALVGRLENG